MPRTNRLFTSLMRTSAVLIAVAMVGACMSPPQRLNAPPQGWSSRQADMQQHYVYMADNALLAEMDVTDVHFVPHTADLNSLGARRLDRYATLLKESGGKLAYETPMTDAQLIQARIASVQEYLKAAGADLNKISIVEGHCGDAGISAEEGIAIQKTFMGGKSDEKSSSGGGGMGSSSGSGSGSGSGGSQY